MACAIGCSEYCSTAAIHAKTSRRSRSVIRSVSWGLPCVSVPVLSKAIVCTLLSCCNASPLRNKIPSAAPRPVLIIIEVGTAKPIAHGQAIISTATAFTKLYVKAGCGPKINHKMKVSNATPITTGTNHMVILSIIF